LLLQEWHINAVPIIHQLYDGGLLFRFFKIDEAKPILDWWSKSRLQIIPFLTLKKSSF
jgi:hypothetical protein